MKLRGKTIAAICALLCLMSAALIGCSIPEGEGAFGVSGGASEKAPETSAGAAASSMPEGDAIAMYQKALEEVAPTYADTIEAETLREMTAYARSNPQILPDRAACEASLCAYFDAVLPFRSQGSLIGPVAPKDFEKACAYIRAEFAGCEKSADDPFRNEKAFEEVLALMATEGGGQSPIPYAGNEQRNFDATRRDFWELYGCTVEPDSYFYTHP